MINKSSFNIETELAEGSFGNVFSIYNVNSLPSSGQYVYKEYKSYARPDAANLSSFVDFYYDLEPKAKDYLDKICSWPHEWVGDKGRVSGVLMPKIPAEFYCNINFSSGTKEVEAKFEHLLIPDKLLKRRHIPLTNKKRYQLLSVIVKDLKFFHEYEICIGDFSHSNVLFSLSDCRVFFLDCDSFRVKGSTAFPQTETGNWGVVEQYPDEELGTKKSDIYKLGLLALRLLMDSNNPTFYQATKNMDYLPSKVDMVVKDVIENSLKEEDSRPSLAEWSLVLASAIENCVEKVEVIESYASTAQQLTQKVIQPAVQQMGQQTYPQSTQYNNQPPAQQSKKSSSYNPIKVGLGTIAIVCTIIIFLVYIAHNKVMNIVTQEESRKVAESNRVETNTETKRKQNLEDVKASIISEDGWEDVTYNDNGDYVEFNLYSSYQIKGMTNSDTGIDYYDELEYTEKSGNTWAQNIASNLKSRVIMNLYNADGTLYAVIRSD